MDSQIPEQAIDVPMISEATIQQRLVDRDLRHSQTAEQLVEMPEFVQFASLLQQQRAEQIVDNLVRSGGPQGFRPGQGSTASSSSSRSADEAVEGGFRTFPRFQKSAESGRQCGDHLAGGVSTLGPHQLARAGVVAHTSSWDAGSF